MRIYTESKCLDGNLHHLLSFHGQGVHVHLSVRYRWTHAPVAAEIKISLAVGKGTCVH